VCYSWRRLAVSVTFYLARSLIPGDVDVPGAIPVPGPVDGDGGDGDSLVYLGCFIVPAENPFFTMFTDDNLTPEVKAWSCLVVSTG